MKETFFIEDLIRIIKGEIEKRRLTQSAKTELSREIHKEAHKRDD